MSIRRLPLFVWMVFINGLLIIAAIPALNAALVMLLADRQLHALFFQPQAGGSALLWQNYGGDEPVLRALGRRPGFVPHRGYLRRRDDADLRMAGRSARKYGAGSRRVHIYLSLLLVALVADRWLH